MHAPGGLRVFARPLGHPRQTMIEQDDQDYHPPTDDLQFGADETRNAAPDDKDDKEFLWGDPSASRSMPA